MWLGKEKEEEEEGGTSPMPVYISVGCQGTSSRYGAAGHLSKRVWTKCQCIPDLGGKEVLLGSCT